MLANEQIIESNVLKNIRNYKFSYMEKLSLMQSYYLLNTKVT